MDPASCRLLSGTESGVVVFEWVFAELAPPVVTELRSLHWNMLTKVTLPTEKPKRAAEKAMAHSNAGNLQDFVLL